MKKMFASLAFAAVTTIAASSVMAATLVSAGDKVTLGPGNGADPGGAFILTNKGPAGTGNLGSFETFCLEYNETFSYYQTLNVGSITDRAIKGGNGVGVEGVIGQYDPLSAKTAFLYTSFSENQSALGALWASTTDLVARGTAMQQAIWFLENEISSTSNALASSLITLANASGWQDTGRVKVLNLFKYNSVTKAYDLHSQDQLYLAPVPLPAAGWLMLSALGLGGWLTKRRRSGQAAV